MPVNLLPQLCARVCRARHPVVRIRTAYTCRYRVLPSAHDLAEDSAPEDKKIVTAKKVRASDAQAQRVAQRRGAVARRLTRAGGVRACLSV